MLLLFLVACSNGDSADAAEEATLEPESAAGHGKTLFTAHCATCHSVDEGIVIVGPSLAGVASTADSRVEGLDAETYFSNSILYPDSFVAEGYNAGTMQQNFASILTSEEVTKLVAYLLTLK